MELLDEKLTGPGPEISVHSGVTFILFFFLILFVYLFICLFVYLFIYLFIFVTFFLTENREAACFTEEHSA